MNLLFGFSGRIGRLKWWLAELAVFVVFVANIMLLAMQMPAGAVSEAESLAGVSASGWIVFLLLLIIGIWINVAATWKRFQDRDKNGLWFLIMFVPFIGGIWHLVECGFLAGTRGPNRYGPQDGQASLASEFGDSGHNIGDLDAKIARMKAERGQPQPARTSPHEIRGRSAAVQPQGFPLDPARRGGFGRRGN
ncbi:MAG: DUF805 domain-containing protein [Notoacmeibacter sp.]|nr:DUF805 domain-containing protein [Notoacmeibacter sp.]MCC0032549.1 DUF805 domain-containing protein [Brucellaceae bacterium]